MEALLKINVNEWASPSTGKMVYKIISDILGVKDLYHSLKEEYNILALNYYDDVKKLVDSAKDPLFEAIIASALGNTLDPSAQHDIDLINDLNTFNPKNLVINDYQKFQKSIENSIQMLILGDNAGEIVFDKLLIETLIRLHPELEIVYAVRDGPIINDATLEDAKFIGLIDIVKVIESPAAPGIEIWNASEEFREYFYRKGGIILSKGQGNFESIMDMDIPEKDVYYLLKAKCPVMEKLFGVNLGDLIFQKKR
jgi:uncharacterized protein with ATP-grasp and redox domains